MSIKSEMFIYTSYLKPILVWSYAAKSHTKLLIQAQTSTIPQILDMSWCVLNFHIYKEIDILSFNDFVQHLNFNFHLALENVDNRTLNALVEIDYNSPINWKSHKLGLLLNTLL